MTLDSSRFSMPCAVASDAIRSEELEDAEEIAPERSSGWFPSAERWRDQGTDIPVNTKELRRGETHIEIAARFYSASDPVAVNRTRRPKRQSAGPA